MSTTRLNMHEAETSLSAHIAALKPGDRIFDPLPEELHDLFGGSEPGVRAR